MKTPSNIATTALCLMLTGFSQAAPPLLQVRAKFEGSKQEAEAAAAATPANAELAAVAADKAQALASFDDTQAAKFGADWLTRWQNSDYQNPDDEAVDIYINDGPLIIGIPTISGTKKQELLAHIAAKPVLFSEDAATVMLFRQHHAGLAGRIEEFAALLPSQGIRGAEYFAFKHLGLAGHHGRMIVEEWGPHMSLPDWFDMLSADAPIRPETYAAARDHLLAQVARLLIEKRKTAGQPVQGPEFDAAIAPVLSALDAPKFDGFSAAVTALGIDLTIPAPDFTTQEAVAIAVASAAEKRTNFTNAWGAQVSYQDGLGSVMFVKGRLAYSAWRNGVLANK